MLTSSLGNRFRDIARAKGSDIWGELVAILAVLMTGQDTTTTVPLEEPSGKNTPWKQAERL